MSFSTIQNSAAVVAVMMFVLWGISVIKKDASIVDPFWSLGFLAISLSSLVTNGLYSMPQLLVLAFVALWALRLSAYLFVRNYGHPEDPRYQEFRRHFGPERYWWVSLFQVFGLQGVLMLLISAPLLLIMSSSTAFHPLHVLGAIVTLSGLLVEAIADYQLSLFKKSRDCRDAILRSGLWKYSRHPNYFGESVVWWGFWVLALPTEYGWLSFPAPLLMTFLLVRVSGVALLEQSLKTTKPKYHEYIKMTSAFVPWFPKNIESGKK